MGLATVLLKGRVRAAGFRRRRHDWQTEEAKVRGLRKDAMVGVCFEGWVVVHCDMRYAQMFNVVQYPGGCLETLDFDPSAGLR
jgi:hypothetical protein